MNIKIFTLATFGIIFASTNYLFADSSESSIEEGVAIGETYVINENFSLGRNISGKGQILYLTSGDAYRNLQAQRYQEWSFATVDSRNLYRVVRNDSVKVIALKFNDNIAQVELLTGPEKGRKYYAIGDELQKNFLKLDQHEKN